jgi:hypothetical protein
MRSILLVIFICIGLKSFSQTDYWANIVYFNAGTRNHFPKGISIPEKNIKARIVLNAIIGGSSYNELKQQYPDSLDLILTSLIVSKVIRRDNDYFEVLFPVLIGEKRNLLKSLIHEKISDAVIPIDSLINLLKKGLNINPEMIFHFLWSRIIDDCWRGLYNFEFKTDKGPPSIAYIIYPSHPLLCGTNFDNTSDNSQIAISWSYNLLNEFISLPSTSSFYDLAMNKSVSEKDHAFFLKHGLIDSNNVSQLFTYNKGDKLDLLCDSLKQLYIDLIYGLFDYHGLSKEYQIPADELFVLMFHEIAYEIFEILNERRISISIPIVKKNNPTLNFSYLISIRIQKPESKRN